MDLGLSGRVAVVTGGNRGIGYAIAHRFVAEGAYVTICGRDDDRGRAAVAELGERATWVRADVTDDASVQALVGDVVNRHGGLDIVVNNAGRFTGGPLHETSDEQFLDGMHTKALAAMRVCRHARPALIASTQGRIVNISGITSHLVVPDVAVTALANSALTTLTGYLAQDLRRDAVTANCVVPGYTLSEIWQGRIDDYARTHHLSVAAAAAAILAERGMGEHARWGTVEEVADVVVFLASGPAAYVSGATLRVDGAQLPTISHP